MAKVTKKLKVLILKMSKRKISYLIMLQSGIHDKEDPTVLEEWIMQMEKIFDVVEIPNS